MHSIAVAEDYCLLIPIGYDPFANEKANGKEILFHHNCYENFHQRRPFKVKKEKRAKKINFKSFSLWICKNFFASSCFT